ncbi:MAG: rhomboid family intramembrane serine protease [Verrucomicrobia bacterium]|nr:rhomboid family intramembrane serine protease [Verrucomicrobiota bacterium]
MQPRPDTDRRLRASWRSLSVLWMLGLVLCFIPQQVVVVHMGKPYDAYLGLSGYGMKSWHLWELFTCQLLHCGLIHLLVNLAALWFLGREVERLLGRGRFLAFWAGTSLAGALVQGAVALAGFLLPESAESVAALLRERFGGPAYGSSIGPCAMLIAWCRLQPGRRVGLRGVVSVKAAFLVWPALGLAAWLVVVARNPNLAHLAHLGGMLAALALPRRLRG